MASGCEIRLIGPAVDIWERCKSFLNYVLDSKFGCVVTAIGGAFGDNQTVTRTKTPALVPQKRFEVLVSKVMVSVHKADLSNFPVDAVVNAANEHLQHVGGLALALSRAGGSQIQQDSDDYIRRFGVLKTGEAVAMKAGSLPCKMIIHAVGPQVRDHRPSESAERLLQNAIVNSLKKADQCYLDSVALPAISSGVFGYPLKECVHTMVRSVKHFCECYPETHLKAILLVDNNELAVTEMKRACARIFSTNPASGSARSKTSTSELSSARSVQLGAVRLTLKQGRIEEERTSVIVNMADQDYALGARVSKAGLKMRQALGSSSVAHGKVVVTGPVSLRCAQVYHIPCTYKSSDRAVQLQILSEVVSECLLLAATQSHQSIAFPTISTAGLAFGTEELAQVMAEAVFQFAKHSSKQMEVYFVIDSSDHNTFKFFEEKMRSLQPKTLNPRPTNAVTEQRDDFSGSGASTAKISLQGSSEESLREAHAWLTEVLLRPSITRIVQNNFITHFGEEEFMQLTNIMCKNNISIKEFLRQGQASIVVTGHSIENVAVAFLEVEKILCKIQEDFLEEEGKMLSDLTNKILQFRKHAVPHHKACFPTNTFLDSGLKIVKVECVENPTLKNLFDLKKNQLRCFTTRKMLQRIPAHFCDMISCIGFRAEFAPPDEPAYGQGIYFTGTVWEAMDMWTQTLSEYLYFVEAEVLTGNSVRGKSNMILPPPVGTDPLVCYDSLHGHQDISVIFSGNQALPVHIITCKKIQDCSAGKNMSGKKK